MKNFIKREMATHRAFYDLEETNKKGEKISVEIMEIFPDNTRENSLPNLWVKHGHTNKLYNSYLGINCYVTDKDGNCYERYNPTIKLSDDKKRNVINFDYLMEVSEENKEKLLKEIYKRFMRGVK